MAEGKYVEAEALFQRWLATTERSLGVDHPDRANVLHRLASLNFVQSQWGQAVEHWRKSADVIIHRLQRTGDPAQGERHLRREHFLGLIKAAYRMSLSQPYSSRLAGELFVAMQWAQSSKAATSLAQMAVRRAKGDDSLSRLIRERQDLVREWEERDRARIAAVSQPPTKRNPANEQSLRSRIGTIETRLGEIDKVLATTFPEYAALASPEPLDLAVVQEWMTPHEALVLILDTTEKKPVAEETFVWAVTKKEARLVRSDLGSSALRKLVASLRCGLDFSEWEGEAASRCQRQVKQPFTAEDVRLGKPLPFDLDSAHDLYKAIFGQIEDLIKDKHLLFVPSGPLTSLPPHVLVTEKTPLKSQADGPAYADAAWLARRHAITILPSVASLKALRQFAKTSTASEPFIGFGNPLLTGPEGKDRRAWDRQTCKLPVAAPMQVASRRPHSVLPKFFRGGLANVEEVRAQSPLPETTDELCTVAESSGANIDRVYLGEKATEAAIKALSSNGTLSRARVVHFATHGLLAGETETLAAIKAEPALILTPPQTATEEDDGLLTASEIAQLKLDADWVVLSACNTAAGESDKPGAEALSGLARAFFYAGARALLVSHWAVNSDATVTLITRTFDELRSGPAMGRAEALRRSMLALIGLGGDHAHPSNWSPFVVVGEGAR